MTERKSLEQLAAGTSQPSGNGIKCPRCGCADFRTYGTIPGNNATFRYKACRHCSHRILTTTSEQERIIRDVREGDGQDSDGLVFRLA